MRLKRTSVKFEALKNEAVIPGYFFLHDLGQTKRGLKKAFEQFETRLMSELDNWKCGLALAVQPALPKLDWDKDKTLLGRCVMVTSILGDRRGLARGVEPVYRTDVAIAYKDFGRDAVRHWFVRGHEEGHAAMYMNFEDEVRELIGLREGPKVESKSDEERICDLCGLYALDQRGLLSRNEPEGWLLAGMTPDELDEIRQTGMLYPKSC